MTSITWVVFPAFDAQRKATQRHVTALQLRDSLNQIEQFTPAQPFR
jgi:hypothetical protein